MEKFKFLIKNLKMGISNFFKFIRETFPDDISEEFELPSSSYAEALYVDMNSVVHRINQRMYKYGLNRPLIESDLQMQEFYRTIPEDQRNMRLFNNIGMFLFYLYLKIVPVKVLMIALDGVPPKSKTNQQRERRYKPNSAPERNTPFDYTDPTRITVGTSFMDALDAYLTKNWITTYAQFFPPGLNIIYSSHREAGEGEHKIFEQMNVDLKGKSRLKDLYGNINAKSTPYQVVVGADSDLIVLSMSKSNNIIFMRERDFYQSNIPGAEIVKDPLEIAIDGLENPMCIKGSEEERNNRIRENWVDLFNSGFYFINITTIREKILNKYIAPADITDFSFISFFVGNDFIPSIPELGTVVAKVPYYFTETQIEERYKKIFIEEDKMKLQDVNARGDLKIEPAGGSPMKIKDVITGNGPRYFSARRFWENFKVVETSWIGENGKINYGKAQGLLNSLDDQLEMFPLITNQKTGISRRIFLFKKRGSTRWEMPKEDIGTMNRCLNIYSEHVKEVFKVRKGKVTSKENYIVEQKTNINYPNLLSYLKRLYNNLTSFLEAELATYEDLKRKGLEPDPLIQMSTGVNVKGKIRTETYVPSAFSGLHNIRAFAIYDAKYADPNLPKQSINEMCRCWLEGIQWILCYYGNGLKYVNTEWFYPFRDAPSLIDLMNYIESRMVCEIPEFPGIQINAIQDFPPTVQVIRLEGYILNIYMDVQGQEIALLRNTFSGKSKFVNLEDLEIRKGRFKPEEIKNLLEEGKFPLVELKRETFEPKVVKIFPPQKEILAKVSGENTGLGAYATVSETLFSILPEHILKRYFDPDFVNGVLSYISDAFPEKFEVITEGQYYQGNVTPKLPIVSLTRLRRAMETVIETNPKYESMLSKINYIRKKQLLTHKSLGVGTITDYERAFRMKTLVEQMKALPKVSSITRTPSTSQTTTPIIINQPTTEYTMEETTTINLFKTKPVVPSLIPYDTLPTNIKYRMEHPKPEKSFHIGQRKLLIDEILFLTIYSKAQDYIIYVVYDSISAISHITILSKLFPDLNFHVWDSNADLKGTKHESDRIKTFKREFKNEDALTYRKEYKEKGFRLIFICDIGTEESNLDKNNIKQSIWLDLMKPSMAMLKFKPPFPEQNKTYEYCDGTIWVQAYGPRFSTETRLIVPEFKDASPKKIYNLVDHENKMYFFNLIIRNFMTFTLPFKLQDDKGRDLVQGITNNFDIAFEIYTWTQYLLKMRKETDFNRLNSSIIKAMNETSRILGKDLQGKDISNKISFKFRDPFHF